MESVSAFQPMRGLNSPRSGACQSPNLNKRGLQTAAP
jgi:hypothetical protein